MAEAAAKKAPARKRAPAKKTAAKKPSISEALADTDGSEATTFASEIEELRALRAELQAEREALAKERAAQSDPDAGKVVNVEPGSAAHLRNLEEDKKEDALRDSGAATQETESITVSFVEDGFTALGRVYYIGEELTVYKDSPEWERLLVDKDRPEKGISIQASEQEQIRLYGRRMFRPGFWEGATYEIPDDATPKEIAALERAQEERRRRG